MLEIREDLIDWFNSKKHEYNTLSTRQHKLEEKINRMNHDLLIMEKADVCFKELIERMSNNSRELVENLVTQGLNAILDETYQFKVDIEQKRGIVGMNLYLLDEDGDRMDIMNSQGGGVTDIISVVLRIITILVSNPPMKRFLALDESFAQLSREHTDKTAEFLKKLISRLNFTIIMVSHNDGFIDHADKVYEIRKIGKYSRVKELHEGSEKRAA